MAELVKKAVTDALEEKIKTLETNITNKVMSEVKGELSKYKIMLISIS